jgi:hypothetical protein
MTNASVILKITIIRYGEQPAVAIADGGRTS